LKINQLVREQKIALLAVQETHLNDDHVNSLHSLFGKRLTILHSASPERETSAQGIAFVINNERLDPSTATLLEIIPGRAALLTFLWHKTVTMRIMTVYAPNSPTENESFWDQISDKINSGDVPKPNVILGDFNIVEDHRDRLPPRQDHLAATLALQRLYTAANLSDAWRETHPDTRQYSYAQDHGTSLSRLDRIYMTKALARTAVDWRNTSVDGIPTDHMMVAVSVSDNKLPFVGTGRWVIPRAVLSDFSFLSYVRDAGNHLLRNIPSAEARTNEHNAQTLYANFKADLLLKARQLAKINIPKLVRRIQKLKHARETLLNSVMVIRVAPNLFDFLSFIFGASYTSSWSRDSSTRSHDPHDHMIYTRTRTRALHSARTDSDITGPVTPHGFWILPESRTLLFPDPSDSRSIGL
ncbi:DNase I-like protein, partial [Trametopsis cervina]